MGVYEFCEGWLYGVDVGVVVNYVGECVGDSSDSGFELLVYIIVDLFVYYLLVSNVIFGVNVNNFFDCCYYECFYNNVWVVFGELCNLIMSLILNY